MREKLGCEVWYMGYEWILICIGMWRESGFEYFVDYD